MDLGLDGKVVLVTGGSKGIGLACAEVFAQEGARVAIASRDAGNLKAAADGLRAQGIAVHTVQADLVDAQQGVRMAAEVRAALGPIDVLVNSAGAARRTPADELTPALWRAAMDAKYFTYVHAIDAVVREMAARGQGAIVNVIGSGGKVASPTHLAGGAANAALMLISAGLANAYAARGVRVNAVNPAATLTERLQQGLEADARLAGISVEEAMRRAVARAPMGRLATPQEIAHTVVYLASAKASHVNGAIVAMDGAVTPSVL